MEQEFVLESGDYHFRKHHFYVPSHNSMMVYGDIRFTIHCAFFFPGSDSIAYNKQNNPTRLASSMAATGVNDLP